MAGPFENGPERTGSAPWTWAQGSKGPNTPGSGGVARFLSVQSWDVAPIPTATNFYAQEQANLILGAAAGSTVLTTQAGGGAFQVPPTNVVSIQAVSAFCDAPSLGTSIVYTVRANKNPIPGLSNIKFPPQVSAYINWPLPGPFNVLYAGGAYLDVLITRLVADVASQVNFTIIGWYNTLQDVRAWTGATPGQVGS